MEHNTSVLVISVRFSVISVRYSVLGILCPGLGPLVESGHYKYKHHAPKRTVSRSRRPSSQHRRQQLVLVFFCQKQWFYPANALRRQKQHGFFFHSFLDTPGLRRLDGKNGKPLEKVARPTVPTAPAGNGQLCMWRRWPSRSHRPPHIDGRRHPGS